MDENTSTITCDQADEACDKLEFAACAIAQMGGTTHSDSVYYGCTIVLTEAVDLLREYLKQCRKGMVA